MTVKEINDSRYEIGIAIANGWLSYAFLSLRALAREIGEWSVSSKLEEYEMLYRQMLIFQYKKAEDPDRAMFLVMLKKNLFMFTEDVCERLMVMNSSLFEYKCKRIFIQKNLLFNEIYASLRTDASERTIYTQEYESSLDELFEYVWLSDKWTEEQIDAICGFMSDTQVDKLPKMLLVSALTLNIIHKYDSKKLSLLLSFVGMDDNELRARTMVGYALIVSYHHIGLSNDDTNMAALKNALYDHEFDSDFEYAYTQIVRTVENERISRKIMDDIMPEVIKASPQIKQNLMNVEDEDDMLNPKWQDMLEDSGIADKLQEFGELQMSGADVYVSTFGPLKHFPFFQKTSNWLMPFDMKNSSVSNLFTGISANIFSVLAKNPQLCNSDKYSFFLSISQMPQSQRDMMCDNMTEQIEQMNEDENYEKWQSQSLVYKACVRRYIQDLYRFYNLFPEHKDFTKPMQAALYLYSSPLYKEIFSDVDVRRRLCEFFFDKDCYVQACEMYRQLSFEIIPDTAFYQRLGFCLFKTGEYPQAIDYYLLADTIQPDDSWTLNAIARAYKFAGDEDNYLLYLEKIYAFDGESIKNISRLANQYISMRMYDKASQLLFKLDYMKPDNVRTLRLLTDAMVHRQEFDKAMGYMGKVMEIVKRGDAPVEKSDLLFMGHLCRRAGDENEAMRCYYRLYEMTGKNHSEMSELLLNDNLLNIFGLDVQDYSSYLEMIEIIPDIEQLL